MAYGNLYPATYPQYAYPIYQQPIPQQQPAAPAQSTPAQPSQGGIIWVQAEPARVEVVRYMGQSPFARAIYGRPARDVWLLMDDLMSAVRTQAPRLYDSVMRQL